MRSDWQLVSTDVSTLLSPYGVSSLYYCEMERLILLSSLLHRWTAKVLCHSEISETAILTDLTSGSMSRINIQQRPYKHACILDVQLYWGRQCINLQ